MQPRPALYWMRRDFRLCDNPALSAAAAGGPVIALFILDEAEAQLGAAPQFRLAKAIRHFSQELERRGGKLILRRGAPGSVLRALIAETGAGELHWNRLYDPESRARDSALKSELRAEGIRVESHNAHLLFEPWTVATGAGGPFRVFSPFCKALWQREAGQALPEPRLNWPEAWPESDSLQDWALEGFMRRGAPVVSRHLLLGESAAHDRLGEFLAGRATEYGEARDRLDQLGCSGLSEPLAWGEIGPRVIWHAGWRALHEGNAGAGSFLRQLIWREFAYHLMFHQPHILDDNWRPEWRAFPWREGGEVLSQWQRGLTGEPMIDAAMRELYVTGRMHNRARMLVASYLCKHLLVHWHAGQRWFAETLVDWDPASNAMGWQWVAGSGPDAAPFFRIFNPATQAAKFDPDGRYRAHWLTGEGAEQFRAARPLSWPVRPPGIEPIIGLAEGRAQALAAYQDMKNRD